MQTVFLKNYLGELVSIFDNVRLGEFESFIEELIEAYEKQSQIFIFGNGGSAASASHFACDINKGVNFGKSKRFKLICLNDNIPTIMAYANDLSYDDIFVEQLKNVMNKDDLVIGISGSGNSGNVLKAIRYANEYDGRTFGICGFDGGKVKVLSQKVLIINSNDMQKIEDLHMIILHCAMQYLCKMLNDEY